MRTPRLAHMLERNRELDEMKPPVPSGSLHWALRLNFRNRLVCVPGLLLMLGSHLWELQAPGWSYAALALQMLLGPFAYLWLARLRADALAAEATSMRLDALLLGIWAGALHFPLWITVVLLISVCLHPMVFGGPRAFAAALMLALGGGVLARLIADWTPTTQASAFVTAMSVLHLCTYLLVLTYGAYRAAVGASALRRELRQSRQDLAQRLSQVESLQERLREQAQRDPLTGLYNRRFLDAFMERELAQSRRESRNFALLVIDIDHFKRINDSFGHLAGDQVIRDTARLIEASARSSDTVARFGGEEFVVVMSMATTQGARERAERLRQSFESEPSHFEGLTIAHTLSIGVAEFPRDGGTQDELVSRADAALYEAKRGGRNRVVAALDLGEATEHAAPA